MQTSIEFKAESRNKSGKGPARAVRRNEHIPGIIYGSGKSIKSQSLQRTS